MLKIYTDKVNSLNLLSVEECKNFAIVLTGFNSLGKVSYKCELSGVESKLSTLSSFSKKTLAPIT